jgi:hypothetical protein
MGIAAVPLTPPVGDESGCVEFLCVLPNALIERARPRIARAVDAEHRWMRDPAHVHETSS